MSFLSIALPVVSKYESYYMMHTDVFSRERTQKMSSTLTCRPILFQFLKNASSKVGKSWAKNLETISIPGHQTGLNDPM